MSSPIKIFICYKKVLSRERDGKVIEQENSKASILNFILKQEATGRYDPWIDDSELSAGVAWETEIYRRILVSDVLVALIGHGTSQSRWVRQEIALAVALGITILPLGCDLNWQEMEAEMKALEIAYLQGRITQNIKLNSVGALLTELHADLETARKRTREAQEVTLRDLLARRNPSTPKAPDNQRAASFVMAVGERSCNLHVASGDISKARGIDVLVNSENDYMQMARFFESRTVSSMLRRRGAQIRGGKYEDTIQHELDWQLRDRGRPVQAGEVFATSAGGPGSELATINKARYILHVAAVQAVAAESTVVPYKQPYQIESCVRASLSKLVEINRTNGVISPPASQQHKQQEELAAAGDGRVKSIIFPLFGTGQGGSPPGDVVEPMLAGMIGFFEDSDPADVASSISDIYLSAFKVEDVDVVTEILRGRFSHG
jgi:O-acetyl-ADP-ribose deacetylase (regulator of RNase III)